MPETLTLRLTIADPLPGVRYSLQDKTNASVDAMTATDAALTFDVLINLSSDGRLTGPFVRREGPTRRFVYIASASRPATPARVGTDAPRSTSTTSPPLC